MRKLLALGVLALLPACGGGGSSPTPVSGGPTPAPAPTPTPAPTPVPAAFGPGQYLVNSRIQPGRYFADPSSGSCYWERESGTGGTLGEIIANDFVGYDARQIIVDILPSDFAFKAEAACGSWFTTPRAPAQTGIPPGMWLVGDQIQPGTYQSTVNSGCYWERLRNFEGTIRSVIANDFVSAAGPRLVTISGSDVGFGSDADCGTWTRATAGNEIVASSPVDIERAWRLSRAKRGVR